MGLNHLLIPSYTVTEVRYVSALLSRLTDSTTQRS